MMEKNELIPFKSDNIFGRIIDFFENLFFKNRNKSIVNENANVRIDKKSFRENIIIQEKNEARVDMNLLMQYRNGDIDEDEMTDEQFECLCYTYKEQIKKLKESNKNRKEKLLTYRKQMQTN